MASDGEIDQALVEVAPAANVAKLRRWVQDAGGTVRSWTSETRLMGIELPARRFGDLATLDGVDYVEVGGNYAP